jgi:dihydropyrimidinase
MLKDLMNFDTIIRGGTVATASDTFACDVGISGGKITALGADLGAATEIVDASGLLVLPGGIDSHVHIAQPSGPGIVMADDFASATRSAAFGGNTMVLPFAMQQPARGRQAVSRQGRRPVLHRRLVPPHHSGCQRHRARPGTAGAGQ